METELVLGIGTLVISAVGAGISTWVMNQWKEQRRFDIQFDMAKRFAVLAFKFDHEWKSAQNAAGPSSDEYKDRPKEDDKSEHEALRRNSLYAHINRLNPLNDLIQEMRVINWEAKATTGEDFSAYISEYAQARNKIRLAILRVFDAQFAELISKGDRAIMAEHRKSQGIMYGYDDGEAIKEAVSANTEALTKALSKYTFWKNKSKSQAS